MSSYLKLLNKYLCLWVWIIIKTSCTKTLQSTLDEELNSESVIPLYSASIVRQLSLLKVFKGNPIQAVLDHSNGIKISDQMEHNLTFFFSDTDVLLWLTR